MVVGGVHCCFSDPESSGGLGEVPTANLSGLPTRECGMSSRRDRIILLIRHYAAVLPISAPTLQCFRSNLMLTFVSPPIPIEPIFRHHIVKESSLCKTGYVATFSQSTAL